jgi:cell filamentation protein, protein adenylyltransferase
MAALTAGRQYQSTHPWLTFELIDLKRAPAMLWLLLGEVRSKIEHLKGVPLRPAAQEEMMLLYLAKGAQATTAIEGNTLTEEEVRAKVDGEKLDLPPSQRYLETEIENVISAFNAIANDLRTNGPRLLSASTIATYNEIVLNGLELGPGAIAGQFRTGSVGVGPYRAAPAEDVPYLIDRLCEWLNTAFTPLDDDEEMTLVFDIFKAVVGHVYFEWIHPFGDGNGRTGRLIEFQILLEAGVPFPASHLLSNHYNRTRTEYYRHLSLASQSGGDLIPFLSYAVQGFVDGLRATIQHVQSEQMDVMWENYVHQMLPGISATAARQRTLVLELSKEEQPIQRQHLMSFSPAVVEAYRGRQEKTLTRDLNVLRKLELIYGSRQSGYVAASDRMRAFLPVRVGG